MLKNSKMAICPECARAVAVNPSTCPCPACQDTFYFAHHMHDGQLCFGSSRGVKREALCSA